MTSPWDLSQELEFFTGKAPLFPLPNIVFYPQVVFSVAYL